MQLQTIEVEGATYALMKDGKPLFKDEHGAEVAYDVPQAVTELSRLRGEAMGHREAKQVAESALKAFEGIDDPAAALKAMETVKNLDDQQLIAAGKAEEMKAQAIKAVEEKFAPIVEEVDGLKAELRKERIGGSFARSKFIEEKLAVPMQMVEATFGAHFSLEDGKMVAKDASGNPLYSKANPGDLATFDEALEILVNASPMRDSILKGRGQSGGGAPGGGAGQGGAKTITRAEYDRIAKAEPERAMKMMTEDGYTVADS